MSVERIGSISRILLVQVNNTVEGQLKPVFVNNQGDEISRFLSSEAYNLARKKEKLSRKIKTFSRTKSHHRVRGFREMSDVIGCLNDEIRTTRSKMETLEGKVLKPIRVRTEGGQIKGYEIDEFASQEKRWWTFVNGSQLLLPVAEAIERYPDSLSLLMEAFDIRMNMRDPQNRDEAKKHFEEYRQKYREISDEQAMALAPIMRRITEFTTA